MRKHRGSRAGKGKDKNEGAGEGVGQAGGGRARWDGFRSLSERALSFVGLHARHGAAVWQALREEEEEAGRGAARGEVSERTREWASE